LADLGCADLSGSVIWWPLGVFSQARRDLHVLVENTDHIQFSTRESAKEDVVVLVTNEIDSIQRFVHHTAPLVALALRSIDRFD